MRLVVGVLLGLLAGHQPALAARYPMPPAGDSVIGASYQVAADHEDTLVDIARRHDIGYVEIRQANPGVDPWLPGQKTSVLIPAQFILPDAPRQGLVLNLAEKRLYYYPPANGGEPAEVVTHPVSIGRIDWQTPLGTTRVVRKSRDPVWTPPASVHAEHAADGETLPQQVPPGPDNPLGRHALYLGFSGYLIHGTNRPYGIGMRVTHGCVRMYPEDIASLFDAIPIGTAVHIVDQPLKVGWSDDVLYLQVQPSFLGGERDRPDIYSIQRAVLSAMHAAGKQVDVQWSDLEAAARRVNGVATPLGRAQSATGLRGERRPLDSLF